MTSSWQADITNRRCSNMFNYAGREPRTHGMFCIYVEYYKGLVQGLGMRPYATCILPQHHVCGAANWGSEHSDNYTRRAESWPRYATETAHPHMYRHVYESPWIMWIPCLSAGYTSPTDASLIHVTHINNSAWVIFSTDRWEILAVCVCMCVTIISSEVI
jgi:hypothetical protein